MNSSQKPGKSKRYCIHDLGTKSQITCEWAGCNEIYIGGLDMSRHVSAHFDFISQGTQVRGAPVLENYNSVPDNHPRICTKFRDLAGRIIRLVFILQVKLANTNAAGRIATSTNQTRKHSSDTFTFMLFTLNSKLSATT